MMEEELEIILRAVDEASDTFQGVSDSVNDMAGSFEGVSDSTSGATDGIDGVAESGDNAGDSMDGMTAAADAFMFGKRNILSVFFSRRRKICLDYGFVFTMYKNRFCLDSKKLCKCIIVIHQHISCR